MKEINPENLFAGGTELVSPVQQPKQKKYLGSVKRQPGLNLYEVNVATLEVNFAKTDVIPVINKEGVSSTRNMLRVNKGCIYVQAMNTKNALRKALKHIEKNSKNTL